MRCGNLRSSQAGANQSLPLRSMSLRSSEGPTSHRTPPASFPVRGPCSVLSRSSRWTVLQERNTDASWQTSNAGGVRWGIWTPWSVQSRASREKRSSREMHVTSPGFRAWLWIHGRAAAALADEPTGVSPGAPARPKASNPRRSVVLHSGGPTFERNHSDPAERSTLWASAIPAMFSG